MGTSLRASSFAVPPVKANGTLLAEQTCKTMKTLMLNLNANSVRFTPDHRVWTGDDIFAAQQRLPFGCSFMVLRLDESGSGTFSKPLLVIAGPMATPMLGER